MWRGRLAPAGSVPLAALSADRLAPSWWLRSCAGCDAPRAPALTVPPVGGLRVPPPFRCASSRPKSHLGSVSCASVPALRADLLTCAGHARTV